MSQAKLAKRVGTSQSAVARYERARAMPDLATLHRIVAACGFQLSLELVPPDAQREANERAALERSVEDRLRANESFSELAGSLRRG